MIFSARARREAMWQAFIDLLDDTHAGLVYRMAEQAARHWRCDIGAMACDRRVALFSHAARLLAGQRQVSWPVVEAEIGKLARLFCFSRVPDTFRESMDWMRRSSLSYAGTPVAIAVPDSLFLRKGEQLWLALSADWLDAGENGWRPLARGTMYLTNRRVFFDGSRSFQVPLGKIFQFRQWEGGVVFSMEGRDKPRRLHISPAWVRQRGAEIMKDALLAHAGRPAGPVWPDFERTGFDERYSRLLAQAARQVWRRLMPWYVLLGCGGFMLCVLLALSLGWA